MGIPAQRRPVCRAQPGRGRPDAAATGSPLVEQPYGDEGPLVDVFRNVSPFLALMFQVIKHAS